MDQSTTRAYRPLALGAGDTTHPGWPLPVQAVPRFTSEPLSGTNCALADTGRGRSVPPSVGTSLSHLTLPQLTSTFFLRFRQDDRYRSHPPWSPLRRRRDCAGCSRRGAHGMGAIADDSGTTAFLFRDWIHSPTSPPLIHPEVLFHLALGLTYLVARVGGDPNQ
jgi:hypothetical protein